MKRYVILNGDRTTSNGTVLTNSIMPGLNGRNIAYENDDVSCPACSSTGKIQCDGPRLPITGPDRRHEALSDDLCICKCNPPPKLVASQQSMSVEA
jgi:hypothetical protein